MTHEELCERARRWLAGSRRCAPVFSNVASCAEIPDAIGWSSCWGHRGSTVVECKTSLSDFRADDRKYFRWKHQDHDEWTYPPDHISAKRAITENFTRVETARMGDYRFFMCDSDVIPETAVEQQAPDHGLIYVTGARRVRIVRMAPRRESLVDKDNEIRYLRFALLNRKPDFSFAGFDTIEETATT